MNLDPLQQSSIQLMRNIDGILIQKEDKVTVSKDFIGKCNM